MDEKKILKDEELEKVNGGASFNVNGSNLEISLEPNESAVLELQQKLDSGIQALGMTLTVSDPDNCLMTAAGELDRPEVIGLSRKCTVAYTLYAFSKKVVIKSAVISY